MALTEKLKYVVTADTKGFVTPMRAVGALAVTALTAAVKITAEFEKELSKLRAVSGANVQEMTALETKARDLGKSTAFTAKEVAELQVELAKLGFTTNDILNSSGGVLDLAAALGAELSEAATLTGSTLRAFGLSTEETSRVVDVLALSASSSALDFGKLTESIKIAAPIAKATNTSIEDTVALLGTLANAGIHGSSAGTGLRKIFIELNAAGLSLNDAYRQINSSSNKLATASDLVGKRAGGALLIMARGAKTTNELADALRNAEGAAEEMRKTMEDNLIGDFDKLKSAVTELGISIGQTTTGPLRSFVQGLTDMINGTEDSIPLLDQLAGVGRILERDFLKAANGIRKMILALQTANPLLTISTDNLAAIARNAARIEELNLGIDSSAGGTANLKGGGTKSKPKKGTIPGKTPGLTSAPAANNSGGFASAFGFSQFYSPEAIDSQLGQIEGLTTKSESLFTSMTTKLSAKGDEIKSTFDGIGLAASAASSLIGQFSQSLLGPDASALARVGVSIIGTLASIAVAAAVAGASESAAATGPAAIFTLPTFIALGLGAVAAALSGTGANIGGSGSSSKASSAAGSINPTNASKIQGAGNSSSVVIRGDQLRYLNQQNTDSYRVTN